MIEFEKKCSVCEQEIIKEDFEHLCVRLDKINRNTGLTIEWCPFHYLLFRYKFLNFSFKEEYISQFNRMIKFGLKNEILFLGSEGCIPSLLLLFNQLEKNISTLGGMQQPCHDYDDSEEQEKANQQINEFIKNIFYAFGCNRDSTLVFHKNSFDKIFFELKAKFDDLQYQIDKNKKDNKYFARFSNGNYEVHIY